MRKLDRCLEEGGFGKNKGKQNTLARIFGGASQRILHESRSTEVGFCTEVRFLGTWCNDHGSAKPEIDKKN